MSNYVDINPSTAPDAPQKPNSFAALINVISSRYVKREYEDPSLTPRVAVKWIMGTTKGNKFERMWTTGITWDDAAVSPDGKSLTTPMSKRSDATYLLNKAIAADFPSEKITNDISIFEGETFFMTEDINPNVKGARKGLYPKQYHPEGWDTALAEALAKRAAREAQQNAPAYVAPDSSYTPPAVVQSDDVLQTANEALVAILQANGSSVTRIQLPAKLDSYVKQSNQKWEESFRRNVLVSLWEVDKLQTIINNNPSLKLEGDTISLQ